MSRVEKNYSCHKEDFSVFTDISEIQDIISSAKMGIWRIEIIENEEPKMYIDETMKELLGITEHDVTPQKTYTDWFSKIHPDAVASVISSVERMKQGYFDENTYLWIHPSKGVRYVRCGGTSLNIPGGIALRGYHYDVDSVVRAEMAQENLLQQTVDEKNEYYSTLGALGDFFYSMHVINLEDDTVVEFNSRDTVKEIVNHREGAAEMMIQVMTEVTDAEHVEAALKFTDLTTLADRMKDKIVLSDEFIGKMTGWFNARFITMTRDLSGRPTKVIYVTRVIDEEKKHEESLFKKSHTDELTGLLNRRAYDEDVYTENYIPEDDKFIYISLDVNGLKVINDTKGHQAGDELIIGSSECMKNCLGPYGKLYRIGGDEFAAILMCKADQLKIVLSEFDRTLDEWSGKYIEGISISYGCAFSTEDSKATVRELAVIAEKRMYEVKSSHYRKKGMDRRGQQDAHKALCELYTKILKINISDDTYQIVNMYMNEQTIEKGFSDSISEWLSSFGKSGQVHPDDLENYLRETDLQYMKDYFSKGKTSLHIFYRRKYDDEFKQVMMEIIPASDYSDDNQNLYLYVKNIDK